MARGEIFLVPVDFSRGSEGARLCVKSGAATGREGRFIARCSS